MRKRQSASSSLELFLDTICNVFGGILFIAILIAIQIRETEGIVKPIESSSPEKITEMRHELDQISTDIAASQVLLETLQATMPQPIDSADRERAKQFYVLSAAKGAAIEKKADLINQHLAEEKEIINWENKISHIETTLQQKESEWQKVDQERNMQQQRLLSVNSTTAQLQSELDKLSQQVTQKENNLKNQEVQQQRNEMVYLPKMRDVSGEQRPHYFVLRFNRFYEVSRRDDFDYTGNQVGMPKKERGVPIDMTKESKNRIRSLLPASKGNVFPSIIVYGDTADQWYIVRDLIVPAGLEYELLPSNDDTEWEFGSSSSATVQ